MASAEASTMSDGAPSGGPKEVLSDRSVEAHLLTSFLRMHPGESAQSLETMPTADAAALLAMVPPNEAVEVLARMMPERGARLLADTPSETATALLSRLEPGTSSALLSRLPAADRGRWLAQLPPALRKDLTTLLAYPPSTAGALMDPRVSTGRESTTAEEARELLRRLPWREGVLDIFVVDEDGRVTGAVPLSKLTFAAASTPLSQLMVQAPPSVIAMAHREEVAELLSRGRIMSLVVTDLEERPVGVIRFDALVEAATNAAATDAVTMVGAGAEERALSKVSFAVKKRLPWLLINLLTAFLASAVVSIFDDTIARYTALAVLMPVVAGQSGNTGAQALAVTMRGLTLREVLVRDWLRVAGKELLVGSAMGVAIAIVTALAVLLWSSSPGLALIIGSSMVLSMAVASLAGASVPMVLTAVGADPAQSSSIVLTTVTDIVGFASFLGTAVLLSDLLPTTP